MYSPILGTFQSRDPHGAHGVDLFDGDLAFGDAMIGMHNLYSYASNNPVNRVDPSGLADKPAIPPQPLGGWKCSGRATTQTDGRRATFEQVFVSNCKECKETCRIIVTANRCFHESVVPGDDRDPKKFFTIFHVAFVRTNRSCDGKPLPDQTSYLNGCELYPGRLVFPGGPLSDAVNKYVDSLKTCDEFELGKMCADVRKVAPPTLIK